MASVSVIICAHNPRPDYFARVLDALRIQTLPLDRWELLLIDNNSDSPLASSWDLSWHPHARHLRETEPGLTAARLCGIRQSTSGLLVFVDDDNALESHYLEIALSVALEWPKIGAFGGSQLPVFEQSPDNDIKDHMGHLAVRTLTETLWTNIKGIDQATPRGAGLCIRRELAVSYAHQIAHDPLRKKLGRSGQKGLLSGEDTDMVWSVCDAGYGMLVTPALILTHYIPAKRLDQAYLLRVAEGHAASNVLLARIHDLPRAETPLVDYARECLKIAQAPNFFDKKLRFFALKGRWRGHRILRETAEKSPSAPIRS